MLCVAAHPDDLDFGSAGTIATWTAAGIAVTYLVVTRGDAGGFDNTPREAMPALREKEQRAAAAAVGVTDVRFLDGYFDGRVTPSLDLRLDITRVIRQVRPDRILTTSPLRRWDRIAGPSHPDHLAVGEATTCAVYPDARNEFANIDAIGDLAPWVVREMWFSAGPNPDYYVDITEAYPRKLAALQTHSSQTGAIDDLDGMLRRMLGASAQEGGLPEGHLAEAFSIIRTE